MPRTTKVEMDTIHDTYGYLALAMLGWAFSSLWLMGRCRYYSLSTMLLCIRACAYVLCKCISDCFTCYVCTINVYHVPDDQTGTLLWVSCQ